MNRLVISFCLLCILISSVGCQMCCTPYDYSISTYIDRCDDYRGFHPFYRAGSILGGENGECLSDARYYENGDYFINAGNYGITSPVTFMQRRSDTFSTQPIGRVPVNVSPVETNNGWQPPPVQQQDGGGIPSIEQLMQQPWDMRPAPVIPPTRPGVAPPPNGMPINNVPFENIPGETIPFSPSDESIIPPPTRPQPNNSVPMESEPPITLEELRRHDPSIQDVQIISVEDAAMIR